MTVATYKQAYGLKQQGALTAPFDGIQGWQFSNSGDNPVVVHLKISGFYDLIPSGEAGNEAGIVANVPVEQARPNFKPLRTDKIERPALANVLVRVRKRTRSSLYFG